MAGTDKTMDRVLGAAPAVILVKPQLGENIGMVARAMLNCSLSELRLVTPRDGWPNESAVAAAAGADLVLDGARLFPTLAAAVADLARVYATTARLRHMVKPVVTPRQAAAELRGHTAAGRGCGVVFGPENFGLNNDDVALADTIINVPLNPAFCSLNLAQAVLLVGHEWFQSGDDTDPRTVPLPEDIEPAEKIELTRLFDHLEGELDATGFLFPPEKRPSMVRNIRNMLQRADLTHQEIQTLRGIIVALS